VERAKEEFPSNTLSATTVLRRKGAEDFLRIELIVQPEAIEPLSKKDFVVWHRQLGKRHHIIDSQL